MATIAAKFEAEAKALMAKVGDKYQPKASGASSDENAKQLEEDDLLHGNTQNGDCYGVPNNFDNELDSIILGFKFEKPEGWGDKVPDKEEFDKWMLEQNNAMAIQAASQKNAIKQAVAPTQRLLQRRQPDEEQRRSSRSPHRPLNEGPLK